MQTVLITGGTGMVGQSLTTHLLAQGYKVIIVSRSNSHKIIPGLTHAQWDVTKEMMDIPALQKADIIVHLAGAGVAEKRWSVKRKKEILDSRVDAGNFLVKLLSSHTHKVKTVISASAIGWYGPDTSQSLQQGFQESDPVDPSFLGNTCNSWEQSVQPLVSLGIRLITLRIGIVLNPKGGALLEFIKPAKFGLATILGSGKQMISWIHQTDLCRMIQYGIENESIKGVYNAVSPHPVSNKELVKVVAGQLHSFYIPIPVPSIMLKIMLGEMSIEVLKSANVSSEKIQSQGFQFSYAHIKEAIQNLLSINF
jgi:uncharacterized protein (TIGR01777 family)